MLPTDISRHIPRVRPHNRLHERKIYFMLSKRATAELSADDEALYNDIDGVRTVAELEKIHPDVRTLLLRWSDFRIIDLILPCAAPPQPHLVVIEPHMDDAVLSAGGRLLHRWGKWRITILSVVKWSNFTSYLLVNRNFRDIRAVTDLRQKESNLAASMLGADHQSLDWSDAPLRFWPADSWTDATLDSFTSTPQAFTKLVPRPGDVSLLAEQLSQTLNRLAPDELWLPMGLGDHVDHRMTRTACLRALVDPLFKFPGIPVSMYEDVPYATTKGHASQIELALIACGARVVRSREDITDVLEAKLRAVSAYASQFKLSYMEPSLRQIGEAESGVAGAYSEAYSSVERLQSAPAEGALARESNSLDRLRKGVQKLMARRKKQRRLTIFALPSGHLGAWESTRQSLLKGFPNAEFKLYVPEDTSWQAEQSDLPGMQLKIVGDRGISRLGWLQAWLQAVSTKPDLESPILVLWRGAYACEPYKIPKQMINFFLRLLLPVPHVFFARTLWDFCCVLEAELETGNAPIDPSQGEVEALITSELSPSPMKESA